MFCFSSSLSFPFPSQRNDRELIVNGYDAGRGRFPFFVTIGDWCGGALIAPDIVLTAGHCKYVLSKMEDGRHESCLILSLYKL
jgi:secreted trypsin-like serine protease